MINKKTSDGIVEICGGMDIKELVTYIKRFYQDAKVTDISTDGKFAYCITTAQLSIGIFDFDYPNENYCGKILAEHTVNFDKWSKAFYKCDFPDDDLSFNLLLSDLEYITSAGNILSGQHFGHLTREFL